MTDREAAFYLLQDHFPEQAALLEGAEELGREFEELREGDVSRCLRYRLFTECAPVMLSRFGATSVVFDVRAEIREMVESRLRAARIWGGPEPDQGVLYPLVLHINYGSRGVAFRKEVWDPLSGEFHATAVWGSSLTGEEVEADPLQGASVLIDRFILRYLRANEGYCQ